MSAFFVENWRLLVVLCATLLLLYGARSPKSFRDASTVLLASIVILKAAISLLFMNFLIFGSSASGAGAVEIASFNSLMRGVGLLGAIVVFALCLVAGMGAYLLRASIRPLSKGEYAFSSAFFVTGFLLLSFAAGALLFFV